jgi:MoxR-like ATPase
MVREMIVGEATLVPSKAVGYVPFGHYDDVREAIASSRFYPIYITGLSGNGKTMMVEQVCCELDRECVRVNITAETDEDDLIGGFRLVDGATVWHDGPVIMAMQRGAVLLLDEVDLGTIKLLCLQPVLEGNGIFIKKINKYVRPAPGFNIVATGNTKGKGSEDGKFIGTNVMNEAFLERFVATFEQDYPSADTELTILQNVLSHNGVTDSASFPETLVAWAKGIRQTYEQGATAEVISTRRLVHIINTFSIYKDKDKSLKMCLARFDHEHKESFLRLYKSLDAALNRPVEVSVLKNRNDPIGQVPKVDPLALIAEDEDAIRF